MRLVRLLGPLVLVLLAACGTSQRGTSVDRVASSGAKLVFYKGVGISVPASWPVLDGGLQLPTCASEFDGQANRVFIGITYMSAPSCPAPTRQSPPADGVSILPGSPTPPNERPTMLPSAQAVYLSTDPFEPSVNIWYHAVSIDIGIGPNPRIEQSILDSVQYNPAAPNTTITATCPTPRTASEAAPTPIRITQALTLPGASATLRPEPASVQPRVDALTIWKDFLHEGKPDPLEWHIYFGSYSAATPGTINPNGSPTPLYQGVPTWLVEGVGATTAYGHCGGAVIAPYNANTGQSMGVTEQG